MCISGQFPKFIIRSPLWSNTIIPTWIFKEAHSFIVQELINQAISQADGDSICLPAFGKNEIMPMKDKDACAFLARFRNSYDFLTSKYASIRLES